MAITEFDELHSVRLIVATGVLEVQRQRGVRRDTGEVVGEARLHSRAIAPGEDLSGEESLVHQVAGLVWTPEVLAAFQARMLTP